MKKIFLFISTVLFIVSASKAQTYGFTKTTSTYTDLTNATSLNAGMVWDDPDTAIAVGFTYQLFGNNSDSLYLGIGVGGIFSPSSNLTLQPYPIIIMTTADIIDRGDNSPNQVSISPISYKVEGTSGSRVFKLEYKNAGFYNELYTGVGSSNQFINMQLWIYEISGDIEFHFGPSNVTQPNLVYDSIGAVHGLSPNLDFIQNQISINSISLEGPADNPTPFKDSTLRVVNGTPSNGTVYRFSNGGTISVRELIKANQLTVKAFPNPARNFISLDLESADLTSTIITIYDINGKLVSIKGFEKNINISDLNSGTYFLEALTNKGRATTKLVKE